MKIIQWLIVVQLFILTNLFAGQPDLSHSCYQSTLNPYTASGYGGQCTAFAWGRACEKMNIHLKMKYKSYPSAKYWYTYEPIDSLNLKMGSTPKSNSIAVWAGDSSNPYGHVAYVEDVSNGYVYFNEANIETYNYTNYGGGYDGYEKIYSIENFENRGTGVGKILGYIYLDDTNNNNLTIYDFWQSSYDGVYKASCYEGEWILDAQFKIKNNSDKSIYIERLALAMHDANGNYLFDLAVRDIYQTLYKGSSMHFDIANAYLTNPGEYKLIAKAYYNNKWHDLNSLNVTVIENDSCPNPTNPADEYIENFYSIYPDFFGTKVNGPYDCFTNYRCVDYDTGYKIAVHTQDFSLYYKTDKWYKY